MLIQVQGDVGKSFERKEEEERGKSTAGHHAEHRAKNDGQVHRDDPHIWDEHLLADIGPHPLLRPVGEE